ncbi:MAG: hypothetical protein NT157_00825 [Candidatus Micrarchaeota archaeon]|nr:hypothetical protein [Candidatus Micrarchaeota archaeon]
METFRNRETRRVLFNRSGQPGFGLGFGPAEARFHHQGPWAERGFGNFGSTHGTATIRGKVNAIFGGITEKTPNIELDESVYGRLNSEKLGMHELEKVLYVASLLVTGRFLKVAHVNHALPVVREWARKGEVIKEEELTAADTRIIEAAKAREGSRREALRRLGITVAMAEKKQDDRLEARESFGRTKKYMISVVSGAGLEIGIEDGAATQAGKLNLDAKKLGVLVLAATCVVEDKRGGRMTNVDVRAAEILLGRCAGNGERPYERLSGLEQKVYGVLVRCMGEPVARGALRVKAPKTQAGETGGAREKRGGGDGREAREGKPKAVVSCEDRVKYIASLLEAGENRLAIAERIAHILTTKGRKCPEDGPFVDLTREVARRAVAREGGRMKAVKKLGITYKTFQKYRAGDAAQSHTHARPGGLAADG